VTRAHGLQLTARALSLAAHPLALMGLLVGALAAPRLRTPQASVALLLATLGVGAALAAFMHLQVRRGAWEHVDASRPEERPALFRFALGLLALALAATLLLPQAAVLTRGLAGALGLFACAYALLRWMKVSLHLAFAAYATGVLLQVGPASGGWLMLVLLPALAWSRVRLQRHRPSETVVGAVVGLAVGLGVALS
jgi:membrane-associated phospholipid phosphatase